MMPRWCNSIPDSEYLAIYDILNDNKIVSPFFVETGSGASTIVLIWFAIKNSGKLFTWDTNGSKLYYLRTIMQDTILREYKHVNLWDYWCPVAGISTSDYYGISAIGELKVIEKNGIGACFLDSNHTLDNLMDEVKVTLPLMKNGSIVIIDDSNYKYNHVNVAYANMLRRKMGLDPKEEKRDNISEMNFGESVEAFLKKYTKNISHIEDTYKENYKSDLFWSYFANDRNIMVSMDMEKKDNLAHRFDAWRIEK